MAEPNKRPRKDAASTSSSSQPTSTSSSPLSSSSSSSTKKKKKTVRNSGGCSFVRVCCWLLVIGVVSSIAARYGSLWYQERVYGISTAMGIRPDLSVGSFAHSHSLVLNPKAALAWALQQQQYAQPTVNVSAVSATAADVTKVMHASRNYLMQTMVRNETVWDYTAFLGFTFIGQYRFVLDLLDSTERSRLNMTRLREIAVANQMPVRVCL